MERAQSLNALADILRLSPSNQAAFSALILSPLIPPLSTPHEIAYPTSSTLNVETLPTEGNEPVSLEWQRGEPEPAVFSAVELAIHGDGTPGREGLRVRAAAAGLFEVGFIPVSHNKRSSL